MIRALLELTRIVAYGGFGILVGYIVGSRASDDHALKASILNASSGDTVHKSGKRRLPAWATQGTLLTATVILIMVALLGTGIASIANSRANARQDAEAAADRARQDQQDEEQRQRLCEAVSELTQTLKKRTQATREAATLNDDLWRGIRHIIVRFSQDPDNPLLGRINVYLDKREELVAEQKANPYGTVQLKDCDG